MAQSLKKLTCLFLLLGAVPAGLAFTLLGPFDTWQTTDLGYNIQNQDLGGPMNLGEEYRWHTPVIVYGYEASFLDYFGDRGVQEVEKAIAILNSLPRFSSMSPDLSEFPLDTRRFNHRATALNLLDLKSHALALLLEEFGLGSPERYMYTLRSRVQSGQTFLYTVIQRNFDPVTLQPSSYVNGTLYSYQVAQTYFQPQPEVWEAVELAVDPLAPTVTAVASLLDLGPGTADFRGVATLNSAGLFYTGLTRDDVGGLRYIYSANNRNVENLPTNAVAAISGGGGSGGTGGSPWFLPGGTPPAGGQVGQVPDPTGGGGGAVATNALVNTALRPGIDKIRLVRADFDSVLGSFFTNVVTYQDEFVTNGVRRQQLVSRVMVQPDIIFSAADLDVLASGAPVIFFRSLNFVNNATINGAPAGQVLAGPGVVEGPVVISFTKIGPYTRHTGETPQELGTIGLSWGSFDGSTNAPVVYPSGVSIQMLEQLISESTGPNPWRLPQ